MWNAYDSWSPARCMVFAGLSLGSVACTSVGAAETDSEPESASTSGSESETATESGTTDLPAPLPSRIGVSADFKAGTVTVFDVAAMLDAQDGMSVDDVAVRTHDLSAWAPGPLEVELVPGRREAVVAVGPGFFGGIVGNLISAGDVAQGGALLHIDLDSGEVLASLDRATPPMGIALTPDASTVLVADYGNETVRGDTVSFIDLDSFTQSAQLVVGAGPEQINISPDGSRAIVNAAGAGTVRSFELADPSATLSAPLDVSGDPSWVHFIDDAGLAMVTNSADPADWAVVDLSDPSAPLVREHGDAISGFPYALARLDADTFVFTSMTVGRFEWHRVDLTAQPSTLDATHTVDGPTVFPLGIAVDAAAGRLVVPMAGDNAIGVIDMSTEAIVRLGWQGETGPTYVVLEDAT